jgi:hypothetical protein
MARAFLLALLASSSAGTSGCEPTPDYRISLLHVPSDAALVMIGWKGDSDHVAKSSLAVPVAQLDADARQRFRVALSLGDAPDESGVLSVATVDRDGCMTSVVSTDSTARSGSSVSQVEIELDGSLNPNVIAQAAVPSPPVMCPPNPPFPPYPAPVACHKVPGLSTIPTEPTLVPTQPVVINTIRQLRGPARTFDSGRLSFFGWGFDRAKVDFGVSCDPSKCFLDLQSKYPQYTALLTTPLGFRYPELTLVSYSQLDVPVVQIKKALLTATAPGFQDGLILCLAVSAVSYTLTNSDGHTAFYAEVLPKQ